MRERERGREREGEKRERERASERERERAIWYIGCVTRLFGSGAGWRQVGALCPITSRDGCQACGFRAALKDNLIHAAKVAQLTRRRAGESSCSSRPSPSHCGVYGIENPFSQCSSSLCAVKLRGGAIVTAATEPRPVPDMRLKSLGPGACDPVAVLSESPQPN